MLGGSYVEEFAPDILTQLMLSVELCHWYRRVAGLTIEADTELVRRLGFPLLQIVWFEPIIPGSKKPTTTLFVNTQLFPKFAETE